MAHELKAPLLYDGQPAVCGDQHAVEPARLKVGLEAHALGAGQPAGGREGKRGDLPVALHRVAMRSRRLANSFGNLLVVPNARLDGTGIV